MNCGFSPPLRRFASGRGGGPTKDFATMPRSRSSWARDFASPNFRISTVANIRARVLKSFLRKEDAYGISFQSKATHAKCWRNGLPHDAALLTIRSSPRALEHAYHGCNFSKR